MGRPFTAVMAALSVITASCTGDDTGSSNSNANPNGARATSAVTWGICDFEVPPVATIDCGTLDVPADRTNPDVGTVRLAFGVIRTESDDPDDVPSVYLCGGPGEDALSSIPLIYGPIYEPLALSRDLVVVDQRGTGLSEPSLACAEYSAWVRVLDGGAAPPEIVERSGIEALDECRERLLSEGIDLSTYNSATSASDLDDLRRALGHDQWNLYGISYGTRLALTSMRDHPDGIRSVVLDATYPIEVNLYEDVSANAERAMAAFFESCDDDTACRQRFGDLEQRFFDLVDELESRPVSITVLEPITGERRQSELDGDGLVGFLFRTLYSTSLVEFVPAIIDAASAGEFGLVGYLMGAYTEQADVISLGMQLAMQCQEEVSFTDRASMSRNAATRPPIADYLTRR